MKPSCTIEEFEADVSRRLERPLPGPDGQVLLAPRPRVGWQPGHVPDDTRPGAALLLVYPGVDGLSVLLTVRDGGLPNHAGQVSLPGGAAEKGESLERAALREAEEEVGLDPVDVRLLGRLTPLHVPVSGFALHVFVGVTHRRPEFTPDSREVARVLEVPIASLVDPTQLKLERRRFGSRSYDVPFIAVDGEEVWGATAMVLAEFLTLLGHPPENPGVTDPA